MTGIRIGIIGCGWISNKAYLPVLKQLNGVNIIAIFDIDRQKVEKCAAEFDISHYYFSENDFFQGPIDAVIITTPNYSHAEYAFKAIKNNKHVLCEKPIVIKTIDYLKIIDEAKKRKLVFIPAFVNRFRNDVAKLFEIIDNNVIGSIKSINAGWIRRSGYPRPGSWFTNKDLSGGGVLIDLGPHVLDICLALFDSPAQIKTHFRTWYYENLEQGKSNYAASWYGQGDKDQLEINVETTCQGKVEFSNQRTLEFNLSWNAPIKNDYTYFTVYGSNGVAQLKTLFGFSTNRATDYNELIIQDSQTGIKKYIFEEIKNEQMQSFKRLCEFFAICVQNNDSPASIIKNGEKTVGLIEELYKNERIAKELLTAKDFYIEQFG
jgi:predicted dehydrogenase